MNRRVDIEQAGRAIDHHRPAYHPRPPRGYINDPNGPIFHDDRWHLYFQSRPIVDVAVPVEWGHLTSTDLVRWQLHRPAMVPQPDGPDRDGCYSGNTILDDGRIRAFYSGYLLDSPFQSVLTALSDDDGRSFGPPRRVIADPEPHEHTVMFRDPFVWEAEDGWRMVVGAGYVDGRAAVRLYTSPDLREWSSLGDLASHPHQPGGGPETGDAWECPQILDLNAGEIAIVGTWSFATGINRVLSFPVADGPSRLALVDHGTNFYAASVVRNSPHGPLMFGWITESRSPAAAAAAGWSGALTLPRQVWLGSDNSVRSAPLLSAASLRLEHPQANDGSDVSAQCEVAIPTAPARVEIRFDEVESVTIELHAETNSLTVDRTTAGIDPDVHQALIIADDAFDETAHRPAARVFLDGSILEVFTSSGRVMTTRVYPASRPPWRIEATVECTVFDLR